MEANTVSYARVVQKQISGEPGTVEGADAAAPAAVVVVPRGEEDIAAPGGKSTQIAGGTDTIAGLTTSGENNPVEAAKSQDQDDDEGFKTQPGKREKALNKKVVPKKVAAPGAGKPGAAGSGKDNDKENEGRGGVSAVAAAQLASKPSQGQGQAAQLTQQQQPQQQQQLQQPQAEQQKQQQQPPVKYVDAPLPKVNPWTRKPAAGAQPAADKDGQQAEKPVVDAGAKAAPLTEKVEPKGDDVPTTPKAPKQVPPAQSSPKPAAAPQPAAAIPAKTNLVLPPANTSNFSSSSSSNSSGGGGGGPLGKKAWKTPDVTPAVQRV